MLTKYDKVKNIGVKTKVFLVEPRHVSLFKLRLIEARLRQAFKERHHMPRILGVCHPFLIIWKSFFTGHIID
jgi:hypothetical protein